ncbi:MAG: bifunctional histidinol-phosphatase/imidazoleglycerol-phosphate dehydratase HisB [Coxiellaceae bacterium]|nr:MAG: bifunctional histidinol-phosphatase/imidazoleglycerol-phosphate dehydratase HisB [Coxiellaceae bacterium]
MSKHKILFIDRDGTLIIEPPDQQIDSLEKLQLLPNVIPALRQLQQAGYRLVMVTNQDGLGTASFPEPSFTLPQTFLLNLFASQGIHFDAVHVCPHFAHDHCDCRKPKLGMLLNYLRESKFDPAHSYVIGDRDTDMQLANNLGVKAIKITAETDWLLIAHQLIAKDRSAYVQRKTNETDIQVGVNLDQTQPITITTGIGFFDHMLEQLAKHGGFSLQLQVAGDLHVDEHHTVEDTALALGQALRQALGDKLGIQRYGFCLPMDEAMANIALDLSGRPYFVFTGQFNREQVGGLATELVPHFFRSLAESLAATLHIQVQGENAHHMIESIFKAVGRALRQAFAKQGHELPSTKGAL